MDQTQFSENQEVLQAPPSEVYIHKDNIPQEKPKKKKPTLLLILGVVLGLVGIFTAVLFVAQQGGFLGSGNQPVATPDLSTPIPSQKPATEFSQRLQGVKAHIQNSDPRTLEVTPPQLNLQLGL